jgi:hypothetical protein
VAILGTETFDVSKIDVASIRLEGIAPLRSAYEDVTTPVLDEAECSCTTEGPDGYMDLTLKFETQSILEVLGDLNDGDVWELYLDGVFKDGTPFEGSDCVLILDKDKK